MDIDGGISFKTINQLNFGKTFGSFSIREPSLSFDGHMKIHLAQTIVNSKINQTASITLQQFVLKGDVLQDFNVEIPNEITFEINAEFDLKDLKTEIIDRLSEHFEKGLKSLKKSADEITNLLKTKLDSNVHQSAKVLKNLGKSCSETAKALKKHYNIKASDSNEILTEAGYESKEIGNAIKGAFDTVVDVTKDTAETVAGGTSNIANKAAHKTRDMAKDASRAAGKAEKGVKDAAETAADFLTHPLGK